jgi:hypothetical protein
MLMMGQTGKERVLVVVCVMWQLSCSPLEEEEMVYVMHPAHIINQVVS